MWVGMQRMTDLALGWRARADHSGDTRDDRPASSEVASRELGVPLARRFARYRAQPQSGRSSPSRGAVPAPVVRTGGHPTRVIAWRSACAGCAVTGRLESERRGSVLSNAHTGGPVIVPLIVICWAAGESANPWSRRGRCPGLICCGPFGASDACSARSRRMNHKRSFNCNLYVLSHESDSFGLSSCRSSPALFHASTVARAVSKSPARYPRRFQGSRALGHHRSGCEEAPWPKRPPRCLSG